MQRRAHRYAVISGKAYRPRLIELGIGRYFAWGFFGIFVVISKVIPIVLLIWSSLLPFFQLPSAHSLSLISLDHFTSQPWDLVLLGARNTLILMTLTPTVALFFALSLSWVVLRSKIPWREPLARRQSRPGFGPCPSYAGDDDANHCALLVYRVPSDVRCALTRDGQNATETCR